MTNQVRKVTLYLSAEEHSAVQALAADEGVSMSAMLRAQLGLAYKRRGAPEGNRNRQPGITAREQHRVERVVDTNHA